MGSVRWQTLLCAWFALTAMWIFAPGSSFGGVALLGAWICIMAIRHFEEE